MQTKTNVLFVWDITTGIEDQNIYAVEYRGEKDWEKLADKARRVAFELTGNRKCMKLTNDGDEPYEPGHKIVRVPLGTRPLAKWHGRSRIALAEFEFGDEYQWNDLLETIQRKMGTHRYWKIDGRSIDWRGRDGYKVIEADTAGELLDAIYKEDIVRVYNGKRGDSFEINAPTHDTPMGSYYHFTPITERTFARAQ